MSTRSHVIPAERSESRDLSGNERWDKWIPDSRFAASGMTMRE
jgi:hypothetical protein